MKDALGSTGLKLTNVWEKACFGGGLLTNAESWINVINQDLEALEKPDSILQRKLLSVSGNPCRAFMMLELGIIPVIFVITQKQMQFLQ